MRCIYCGRYMSYSDLNDRRAIYEMTQPDSIFGPERWEGYHYACKDKSPAERQPS